MLVRRITLIFIYLQIVQAILSSDFNVQHYVQHFALEAPFQPLCLHRSARKKRLPCFGNRLISRAVDEDWTRDLFLTKEVLYHWATTAMPWNLMICKGVGGVFRCGVQHYVQHYVQQSLPAIACRLMIKWFIDSELCGKEKKRGQTLQNCKVCPRISWEKRAGKFSPALSF